MLLAQLKTKVNVEETSLLARLQQLKLPMQLRLVNSTIFLSSTSLTVTLEASAVAVGSKDLRACYLRLTARFWKKTILTLASKPVAEATKSTKSSS